MNQHSRFVKQKEQERGGRLPADVARRIDKLWARCAACRKLRRRDIPVRRQLRPVHERAHDAHAVQAASANRLVGQRLAPDQFLFNAVAAHKQPLDPAWSNALA